MVDKVCSRCKTRKSITEFYKDSHNKDGLQSRCKSCNSIVCKECNAKHKEKRRESKKRYKEAHKQEILEYMKTYRIESKDKITETTRKYWQRNKHKKAEYGKRYRERHSAELKEFRIRNRNKRTEYQRKRKAREKEVLIKATQEEINKLIRDSNNICFWCDNYTETIHIDHIYPLTKGGEHSINNLCVSCPSCNLRKSDKDPEVWLDEILEGKIKV